MGLLRDKDPTFKTFQWCKQAPCRGVQSATPVQPTCRYCCASAVSHALSHVHKRPAAVPFVPQGINSQQLAAASFGSVMLQTVGRVYQTEADIFQGNTLMGGLVKLRRAGHSIKYVSGAVWRVGLMWDWLTPALACSLTHYLSLSGMGVGSWLV
jgi:hypothetical protein